MNDAQRCASPAPGSSTASLLPHTNHAPRCQVQAVLDLRLLLPLWFGFAFGKCSRRAYDGALDTLGFRPTDGMHAKDYLLP